MAPTPGHEPRPPKQDPPSLWGDGMVPHPSRSGAGQSRVPISLRLQAEKTKFHLFAIIFRFCNYFVKSDTTFYILVPIL